MALLFFTVLVPSGIYLPYFPLWLEEHGFSPEKIAVILSAPMFLRVATTPLFTSLADKASDRVNVYLALAMASVVVSAGYFLSPSYASVLIVSLVLAVVWTPHSPIANSLALSGVRRFGANYPRMRIWGSISYLCANLVGGFILTSTGAGAVPIMLFVSFCAIVAIGLMAPRLGRPRRASPLSATDLQQAVPSLLNPYFLYFAAGAGVIVAATAFSTDSRPSIGNRWASAIPSSASCGPSAWSAKLACSWPSTGCSAACRSCASWSSPPSAPSCAGSPFR